VNGEREHNGIPEWAWSWENGAEYLVPGGKDGEMDGLRPLCLMIT